MFARAATGRRRIIKIDGGYHGTAPWMRAAGAAGKIADDQDLVITIAWNDVAALAALNELKEVDAANLITDIGTRLGKGLQEVATSNGYTLIVSGIPGMRLFQIEGDKRMSILNRWVAGCVDRGAYLLGYHNNFVSADDDYCVRFRAGLAHDSVPYRWSMRS